MSQNLVQLALITELLINWDGILLRMQPIPPTLADGLRDIADTAPEPPIRSKRLRMSSTTSST